MKAFNAFQLVASFAAWPMLIQWLHSADFYAHNVAFWVALVAYVYGFGALIFCVGEQL
jgi:hypothetical protein